MCKKDTNERKEEKRGILNTKKKEQSAVTTAALLCPANRHLASLRLVAVDFILTLGLNRAVILDNSAPHNIKQRSLTSAI